jgi:hypothetical protein
MTITRKNQRKKKLQIVHAKKVVLRKTKFWTPVITSKQGLLVRHEPELKTYDTSCLLHDGDGQGMDQGSSTATTSGRLIDLKLDSMQEAMDKLGISSPVPLNVLLNFLTAQKERLKCAKGKPALASLVNDS